jgi:hypothetical protein
MTDRTLLLTIYCRSVYWPYIVAVRILPLYSNWRYVVNYLCRSLFALLYFFFWPLFCLFFDIQILITPLSSSNSSNWRHVVTDRIFSLSIYCHCSDIVADCIFWLTVCCRWSYIFDLRIIQITVYCNWLYIITGYFL